MTLKSTIVRYGSSCISMKSELLWLVWAGRG